jgi:glycosyltransferase involved in cell wall biosynthesis
MGAMDSTNAVRQGHEAGGDGLPGMVLSVVVPVRNEREHLGECLQSLTQQSEPGWVLGEHWELLVVDDGSTDESAQIASEAAEGRAGVRVLQAPVPLPKGWTGKAHALGFGAEQAHGRWLLFTDADVVEQPGVLSRSVVEAERYRVGMLSYGPRQVASGLLERALLPLVFSEIATAYPVAQVNEPEKRVAFANGQFLLVSAEAYRKMGGHGSVASLPDADVALAFLAKRGQYGLRYRYAPEAVKAYTEAGFAGVWASWVRKLALLVNNTLGLALWRVLDILLIWGLLLLAIWYPTPFVWVRIAFWLFWLRTLVRVYRRAARSNFKTGDVVWSMVLGLPLFVGLAYMSWMQTRMLRRVSWKGREYPVAGR